MAVVETLEVRFQADMGNLAAQLKELSLRIEGMGAALEAGRGALTAGAAGLIQGVADALRSGAGMSTAPAEAGGMMTDRFAGAILGGMGGAAAAAQKVALAAKFSGSGAEAAAYSAGAALSQGFANGISSKYGAVMSAVNRIVNAAVSRIRSALSIHSPSKVSFELGGFFGEGFAEGVRSSMRMAQKSAGALSMGAAAVVSEAGGVSLPEPTGDAGIAGTVRAAVEEALGGTSFVIPLHVDGVKLGEASIRGINRVTRSAGRLMLEI